MATLPWAFAAARRPWCACATTGLKPYAARAPNPRVIMEFADVDLAHGLFTGTASTIDEMCRGTIRLAGMISMADNLNRILDRVGLYLA